MAKKIQTLNLTEITTRAKAVKALAKLGFEKQPWTLTRGTVMYKAYDLSVCLAPENFMATDHKSRGEASLGFIPTMLHIGNTSESARAKLNELVGQMLDCGVVKRGADVPLFGLAVGLGFLAKNRAGAEA